MWAATRMQRQAVWTAWSALAVSLSIMSAAVGEEPNYPTHPVRMIAASAAGGNPDVMARLLVNRLSEVLKSPFIVEDVPGVGGVIAAKRVAAASPDGYNLMLNDSGALAISILTNPDADYRLEDFTPITALASLPTVLVVKPSVPVNTLSEFVALAKSKPGAMSFGSAGAGSIHQLTMVIFEQRAGIELLHVPYRGGTGLVNALLTGEVDAGWSGIGNVLSLIRTGKLRALCLSVLQTRSVAARGPDMRRARLQGFRRRNDAWTANIGRRVAGDRWPSAIRGREDTPRAGDDRTHDDARHSPQGERHGVICPVHEATISNAIRASSKPFTSKPNSSAGLISFQFGQRPGLRAEKRKPPPRLPGGGSEPAKPGLGRSLDAIFRGRRLVASLRENSAPERADFLL